LARHLIEMHGGSITVESAGRDQGATFVVKLPTAGASVARGRTLRSVVK
jgi:signal transduction histidine kinase